MILALTADAARQLLAHSSITASLADQLREWVSNPRLRAAQGVAWGLRIAVDHKKTDQAAMWHPDYMSGTGSEDWAFLILDGPYGFLASEEFVQEGLERALYIAEQRLRGRLLDGALINKNVSSGVRRCVIGNGFQTRQQSIVYLEELSTDSVNEGRSVIMVGPTREESGPVKLLLDLRPHLNELRNTANDLVYDGIRPSLDLTPPLHVKSIGLQTPEVPVTRLPIGPRAPSSEYSAITDQFTYEQWIAEDSPLNKRQREILNVKQISNQPIRIVGAAGSGKTLLMTLLVGRVLRAAQAAHTPLRVLYVTHNTAMRNQVFEKLITLGYEEFLHGDKSQTLQVATLAEYAAKELDLADANIIDTDAAETKDYQSACVQDAIVSLLKKQNKTAVASVLSNNPRTPALTKLLVTEIGLAIKGNGFQSDPRSYIESERPLTRFHSVLTKDDRRFVFDIFIEYDKQVFQTDNLLDADDIALSLLGRLRTPLWQMKRKSSGVDYLFVDEAQLFNDNERRLFSLLSRGTTSHIPVVLALDEAQDLTGAYQAGLGTLGIDSIHDEELKTTHRCTPAIIQLGFYVLQRTTALFSVTFPHLSHGTVELVPEADRHADSPRYVTQPKNIDYAQFVAAVVQGLRDKNMRSIAVSFHAENNRAEIETALRAQNHPIKSLRQRGEKIPTKGPLVTLARAEDLGGQEFDAVVCVGLEHGVTPPSLSSNHALESALEQRALREMYLAFTRARYRLVIPIERDRVLCAILQQAANAGLLRAPS